MLQIDRTLVSLDVVEKKFICDLDKCKGICCVEGDSGAPLTNEEQDYLSNNIEKILPYLDDSGKKSIQENGISYIDREGDNVTMLVNNAECAFAVQKDGMYMCGIENAYKAGDSELLKPISCHLYPIRIVHYHSYDAINYDKWDICKHACLKGKNENVSVKSFLKAPLIRKYGESWYNKLDEISKELSQE